MPIDDKILARIRNNDPELWYLNLNGEGVTDADLELLVLAMEKNNILIGLALNVDTNISKLDFDTRLFHYNRIFFDKRHSNIIGEEQPHETPPEKRNRITANGVRSLLCLTNLQYLDISGNHIGDGGVKRLSSLPGLKKLWIVDCNISEAGAKYFFKFQSLWVLDYWDNPFAKNHNYYEPWGIKVDKHLKLNRKKDPLQAQQVETEELEKAVERAMDEQDIACLETLILPLPQGVNTRLEGSRPLLFYACQHGLYEVQKFLLDHGAKTEEHEDGYTPLDRAVRKGDQKTCKRLLQHGANITGEVYFNDETPFSKAAFDFNIKFFSSIIASFLPFPDNGECTEEKLLKIIKLLKTVIVRFCEMPVNDICESLRCLDDLFFTGRVTEQNGADPEGQMPSTYLTLLTHLSIFPTDKLNEIVTIGSVTTNREACLNDLTYGVAYGKYKNVVDKLCDCIMRLYRLHNFKINCQNILDILEKYVADIVTYYSLNNEVNYKPNRNSSVIIDCLDAPPPPWFKFGSRFEELTIGFTQRMLALADKLNPILDGQYAKEFEEMQKYRTIWSQFKERRDTCLELVDLAALEHQPAYDTDDVPSEDSDDEAKGFRPMSRVRTVTAIPQEGSAETSQLPEERIRVELARLNEEIKLHGEKSINWSKYPKLFIAQYRGVHFYRNMFTPKQRRLFRNTIHLNRDSVSAAVFELAGTKSPAHEQLTRETRKKLEMVKIRQRMHECSKLRPKVQQRFSNRMPGFRRDIITTDGNVVNQCFGKLGITKVPFYPTADLPSDALKYAYGQKPDKELKKWRLRPRYTKKGKAKFPYPGMVFIYLFTPEQWLRCDPNHVIELHQQGKSDIDCRIVNERETSFHGGIEQEYSFYEQVVKIPSFLKYTKSYRQKYGISEKDFEKFRHEIRTSKPGSEASKKVKKSIINKLILYQAQIVLEKAREEIAIRGGYLVYKQGDGSYGLNPPDMKYIKAERKKEAKPAKKKKMKKASPQKIKVKDRVSSHKIRVSDEAGLIEDDGIKKQAKEASDALSEKRKSSTEEGEKGTPPKKRAKSDELTPKMQRSKSDEPPKTEKREMALPQKTRAKDSAAPHKRRVSDEAGLSGDVEPSAKRARASSYQSIIKHLYAQGDDINLATCGRSRNYWYSIADVMALLRTIRQQVLNYSVGGIASPVKAVGEEYEFNRENQQHALLTNPYIVDSANPEFFIQSFLSDIKAIAGKLEGEEESRNHSWQHSPQIIVIPILTGAHWRCVRITIDYVNSTASILWDDPYGRDRFDLWIKQQMRPILIESINILLRKEEKPELQQAPQEMDKPYNQQGDDNGVDCGPITVNNCRDYLTHTIQNEDFITTDRYTIKIADVVVARHEQQIKEIRAAHVSSVSQETDISRQKLPISLVKQAEKTCGSLCEMSKKIGELSLKNVDLIFNFVYSRRIETGVTGKISDGELKRAYRQLSLLRTGQTADLLTRHGMFADRAAHYDLSTSEVPKP